MRFGLYGKLLHIVGCTYYFYEGSSVIISLRAVQFCLLFLGAVQYLLFCLSLSFILFTYSIHALPMRSVIDRFLVAQYYSVRGSRHRATENQSCHNTYNKDVIIVTVIFYFLGLILYYYNHIVYRYILLYIKILVVCVFIESSNLPLWYPICQASRDPGQA